MNLQGNVAADVLNCEIVDCHSSGVAASDGALANVLDCQIHRNGNSGVTAHSGSTINVERCDLRDNQPQPIFVDGQSHATERDNQI